MHRELFDLIVPLSRATEGEALRYRDRPSSGAGSGRGLHRGLLRGLLRGVSMSHEDLEVAILRWMERYIEEARFLREGNLLSC
jgi:hypothetical protein